MIGTTIEFYDFNVYPTAAVTVFPHVYSPPGQSHRCAAGVLARSTVLNYADHVGGALHPG